MGMMSCRMADDGTWMDDGGHHLRDTQTDTDRQTQTQTHEHFLVGTSWFAAAVSQ